MKRRHSIAAIVGTLLATARACAGIALFQHQATVNIILLNPIAPISVGRRWGDHCVIELDACPKETMR